MNKVMEWLFHLFKEAKELEISEVSLGIGSNRIKLKVNSNDDRQIAYKIWVELITRKIGIEVNPEEDVITEVYNSWYDFFRITRNLIKEIPISKIESSETQKIIKLSVDILNKRIRPHLTKWQAKFRKWYDQRIKEEEAKNLSPQQIQKGFPQYEELIKDLLQVNKNLVYYQETMQKIIGFK